MSIPSTKNQVTQGNQIFNANVDNNLASIIIPNYNHAQYVGEAIQSVLDQSYRNFEIIVVDDGSTDNSREVIESFGNSIRVIYQQNQGLSAARNNGIGVAKGAFIGVLDADDMYERDFLSTLVAVLDSNPDAGAVYCGYQFVDHKNYPLPQVEARQIPSGQVFQSLADGNFLVPESILVRRYCYENLGPFDETLRACEDWDMWLSISRKYRIVGTNKVLTRHRILPGSMSTDPNRMFNNRLAVVRKHFGPEPSKSGFSTLVHRVYGRAYLASCVENIQCQDEDRAYECFCNMALICPSLLTELDTFYQLGCGDQPKGSLGNFDSLNLQRNELILKTMLSKLFSMHQSTSMLRKYRRSAYANAYLAFGLLSYGSNQFHKTRGFLFHSIAANPRFGFNRRLVFTLLKSLLGVKVVNRLKITFQRKSFQFRGSRRAM